MHLLQGPSCAPERTGTRKAEPLSSISEGSHCPPGSGEEDGLKGHKEEGAERLLGLVNVVVVAVGLPRICSHKIFREKPYVADI